MRLLRESLPDPLADRELTRGLVELTESTGDPGLRVWTPPRQVAFGRRDSAADGYRSARRIAAERGYDPIERSAGGRAVAHTGTTVAFALVSPTEPGRSGITSRYRDAMSRLSGALEELGASVDRGEPSASFCPGTHSLQRDGKIAGLAQRVRTESALLGGYVIVRSSDAAAVSTVLDPVYAALGLPFDPASVGSVEAAGGPASVEAVTDAIEAAFAGDAETTVIDAAVLPSGDAP